MVRLFGLVASFHGIIMGYSRQIYSLARGYSPRQIGDAEPPHLHAPSGDLSLASPFSDSLITISGMPLTACIVADVGIWRCCYVYHPMAALKLSRKEPKLIDQFRAPLYPCHCAASGGTLPAAYLVQH